MIRCWQCGEDLEGYKKQDLDLAYDQGYLQAVRDIKNAKIDKASCATTARRIQGYANS